MAFDPFSAAALGGAANVGMNLYSINEAGNEAHEGRQWSQDMRSSAYQATVADLKKANLNPMLAYSKGPTSAPGASTASIPSGESASAGAAHGAQVALTKEQTRNVGAEADRNEQIAAIIKSIAPRIVQGVAGVESAAGSVGSGAARVMEAIEKAMGNLSGMKMPSVSELVQALRELIPSMPRIPSPAMPAAVKNVVEAVGDRSRTPLAVPPDRPFGSSAYRHHFGMTEYERAQDERFRAARKSPASRRRGGD